MDRVIFPPEPFFCLQIFLRPSQTRMLSALRVFVACGADWSACIPVCSYACQFWHLTSSYLGIRHWPETREVSVHFLEIFFLTWFYVLSFLCSLDFFLFQICFNRNKLIQKSLQYQYFVFACKVSTLEQ